MNLNDFFEFAGRIANNRKLNARREIEKLYFKLKAGQLVDRKGIPL